jgi:hypothetical protein
VPFSPGARDGTIQGMPEKRLSPVYADRVLAAREQGDLAAEASALNDLTVVCRRAGAPVEALLDDARRRALLGLTAEQIRPALAHSC